MNEHFCPRCGRWLGKTGADGTGTVEFRCYRCKVNFHVDAATGQVSAALLPPKKPSSPEKSDAPALDNPENP